MQNSPFALNLCREWRVASRRLGIGGASFGLSLLPARIRFDFP